MCKIGKGTSTLNFGLFYRPPSSTKELDKHIFSQIKEFCKGKAVIVGDFNFPGVNWTSMEADNHSSDFRDACLDSFLHQHVHEATRLNNILDLVLSTDLDIIHNVEVVEPLGNSDHNSVNFDLVINSPFSSSVSFYNFNKGNYDEMRKSLKSENWDETLKNVDTEKAWTILKTKLCALTSKYVPRKQSKSDSKPKWLNSKVKSKIKSKKQAWKKYKSTKTERDYNRYKECEKEAKSSMKRSKKDLEKKLAANIKKDPKSFYSYVNNKKSVKSKIGPIQIGQELLTEDKDIAQALNNFFTSVFTKEDLENLPNMPPQVECELKSIEVTKELVQLELNKLKTNKAAGVDEIYSRILKECSDEVVEPLTLIFNKSIKECKVPNDWKTANVTPLFKKGSKKDPGNYRPVSLTSIPGKMLESIMKKQMVKYIENNSLLKNTQHGFLSGRSCLTNLLEYLEYVTCKIDEKKPVDVIYLDFSKAFDKVPHARLLMKLKNMGFETSITNWIKEWLSERTQRVVLNGSYSDWAGVCSGVPQGSVLGPLLFLVYVNDMDCGLEANISKFADDTKIFHEVSSLEDCEMLQTCLDKLKEWSETWQMQFNASKCKVLHFGKKNKEHSYKIGEAILETSDTEKDLGVYVQSNLKPDKHIDEAVKKANQILGQIYRTIENKTTENIIPLYLSLVRPHLEYCVQAWSPYYAKDIVKLEKVQRRALNMITDLKHLDYQEKLLKLDLFSLSKRRLRGDMIETFKIMNEIDKIDSNLFFTRSTSNTRGHNLKLYKGKFRCDARKYFYSQRVVDPWNRLPSVAAEASSLNSFKNNLDKYFAENNIT